MDDGPTLPPKRARLDPSTAVCLLNCDEKDPGAKLTATGPSVMGNGFECCNY